MDLLSCVEKPHNTRINLTELSLGFHCKLWSAAGYSNRYIRPLKNHETKNNN